MPLTNMSTDHRQLLDAGLGSVLLDPEPKVFNCRDMIQGSRCALWFSGQAARCAHTQTHINMLKITRKMWIVDVHPLVLCPLTVVVLCYLFSLLLLLFAEV